MKAHIKGIFIIVTGQESSAEFSCPAPFNSAVNAFQVRVLPLCFHYLYISPVEGPYGKSAVHGKFHVPRA